MQKSSSIPSAANVFRQIKSAYETTSKRDPAIVCKQGAYADCHVLKLQKPTWTNDDMRKVPNESGIFFSIWLNKDVFQNNKINYNIHALKLRRLCGHKITSRDFAQEFRQRFAPLQHHWPNVSVDFGSLTLMEGWVELVVKTFERDVVRLMHGFAEITPIIDELLEKRRINEENRR